MNKSIVFSSRFLLLAILLGGFSYAMENHGSNDNSCSHNHIGANANNKPSFLRANWNDFTAAIGAKKTELAAYATSVKTRGWTGLSKGEQAAFVAVGVVAVVGTVYAICKLYQSWNKTDKNHKGSSRKNRN